MRQSYLLIICCSALILSCKKSDIDKDATGVFEATEIVVSAESMGKLLSFQVQEGQQVRKDEVLGQIDSVQLHLKKMQLKADQSALKIGKPDISSQMSATKRELDQLEFEKKRIQRLLEGDVATQKQMDDIDAQIDVIKARLNAQKTSLNSNNEAIDAKFNAVGVQVDQLSDQIERCTVKSPIDGTVLVKYTEPGEYVTTGKPLFKVADLEHLILRAYVTGEQLKDIHVGQKVVVPAEFGSEAYTEYEGQITWISEKSEFTPKTIQTQDERANLVYAVKVDVKNDGNLKIGMYGGIKWSAQ
jgi:HlyD family secretion protein